MQPVPPPRFSQRRSSDHECPCRCYHRREIGRGDKPLVSRGCPPGRQEVRAGGDLGPGVGKGQLGSALMWSLQTSRFLTEALFGYYLYPSFIFAKVPGRTFFHYLSKFITFATAPLVLTPFVRIQQVLRKLSADAGKYLNAKVNKALEPRKRFFCCWDDALHSQTNTFVKYIPLDNEPSDILVYFLNIFSKHISIPTHVCKRCVVKQHLYIVDPIADPLRHADSVFLEPAPEMLGARGSRGDHSAHSN